MAEEIKNELESKKVEAAEAEGAAGGMVGPEKYSQEEYSKAGVSWDHNFWKRDTYYIRGVKIDQKTAESITDDYFALGRQLTNDELYIKYGILVKN